jgi:tRNA A58 N-methylase Trm61
MATDMRAIIKNLVAFYDFGGKDVLHVGAGGGQLIGYAHLPRKITAVDSDRAAVECLRKKISECDLDDKFTTIEGDFHAHRVQADVVFFEFCLHEMADPVRAIGHAATLAPHTLIIDHLPESEWSWCACETEKISASWTAIEETPLRRKRFFDAKQRFVDFGELSNRLAALGEETAKRIRRYESCGSCGGIEISMPYGIVLI